MRVFINEKSLNSQYINVEEFESAVIVFTSLLNNLRNIDIPQIIYKDSYIENNNAIVGINFKASLHLLRDKFIRNSFINIVFNKMNPVEWRTEMKHSIEDSFLFNTIEYSDTTIGEISERVLIDVKNNYLLINFTESDFKNINLINVIKNGKTNIDVDCIDNNIDLETWIEEKYHLSRLSYRTDAKDPPTDLQTILRDRTEFKKTNIRSKDGRTVYVEINTNRYWYVDNLHFGLKAHLEVFSKNHKHIGESDLNGEINTSKRDKKKIFKE
jgi:hypothetical protein